MTSRYVLLVACAAGTLGCSARLSPEKQVESGRMLFEETCLECHTTGTGPPLSREVLAAHRSAKQLYDYVRFAMPYEDPGSLEDQDYWDIVAFLSLDRELRDTTVVLSPETAGESFR